MRTSEVAARFGVHPNTVRLYEEWGYLPPIPRDRSGQRRFTEAHIAQMTLARCALHQMPTCGSQFRDAYKELVWTACAGQIDMAITQARKQLGIVQLALDGAECALRFLRGEMVEQIEQAGTLSIQKAAAFVRISVPILRRWEAYGLISVPRHAKNGYRVYGKQELGWLLVVQSLRLAGHTVELCRGLIEGYQKAENRALCEAMATCGVLFSVHEAHTEKVLVQLQHMNSDEDTL